MTNDDEGELNQWIGAAKTQIAQLQKQMDRLEKLLWLIGGTLALMGIQRFMESGGIPQ